MTRDEAMLAVSTGDFNAIDALYDRLEAAERCIEAAVAARWLLPYMSGYERADASLAAALDAWEATK